VSHLRRTLPKLRGVYWKQRRCGFGATTAIGLSPRWRPQCGLRLRCDTMARAARIEAREEPAAMAGVPRGALATDRGPTGKQTACGCRSPVRPPSRRDPHYAGTRRADRDRHRAAGGSEKAGPPSTRTTAQGPVVSSLFRPGDGGGRAASRPGRAGRAWRAPGSAQTWRLNLR
jgi:hypothetical protein